MIAAKFLGFYSGRAIIRGFEGPGIDDLVAPGQEIDPVRPHVLNLAGNGLTSPMPSEQGLLKPQTLDKR